MSRCDVSGAFVFWLRLTRASTRPGLRLCLNKPEMNEKRLLPYGRNHLFPSWDVFPPNSVSTLGGSCGEIKAWLDSGCSSRRRFFMLAGSRNSCLRNRADKRVSRGCDLNCALAVVPREFRKLWFSAPFAALAVTRCKFRTLKVPRLHTQTCCKRVMSRDRSIAFRHAFIPKTSPISLFWRNQMDTTSKLQL